MSNPRRRTGTDWEQRLADYFTERNTFGGPVFRAPRWGAKDKGDLVNTAEFTIEAKAHKKIDLAEFIDEALEESQNADTRWGVAIVKRRNHPTHRAYAVMQLDQWSELAERRLNCCC